MASYRIGLACLVLCVFVTVSSRAQNPNQHRGQVVIAGREDQGVFAQVTAYEAARPETQPPGCPKFEKQLTQTNSNKADGVFTLNLGATPPSYVATYCADGYVPRVDKALQNTPGEPVIPKPVPLVRRDSNRPELARILGVEVQSFLSNVRYYREANPDFFNEAVAGALGPAISPEERNLLEAVRRAAATPGR